MDTDNTDKKHEAGRKAGPDGVAELTAAPPPLVEDWEDEQGQPAALEQEAFALAADDDGGSETEWQQEPSEASSKKLVLGTRDTEYQAFDSEEEIEDLVLESGIKLVADITADKLDNAASLAEKITFEEQLSLAAQVEAILFASPSPMKPVEIFEVVQKFDEQTTLGEVEDCLKSLVREFGDRGGGFRLVQVARQGYQFQTIKAASKYMEHLFSARPRPLSRAALETLAIIAYRQPVTRADIEFIRGVDSGSIVKNLLERDLIICVGRKEEAGRPMVFGTTDEFLTVFGLASLEDLPSLMSFQPSAEVIKAADKKLAEMSEDVDLSEIISGDNGDPDLERASAAKLGRAGAEQADLDDDDRLFLAEGASNVGTNDDNNQAVSAAEMVDEDGFDGSSDQDDFTDTAASQQDEEPDDDEPDKEHE